MELQGKDQTSPYAWTVGKWWTCPVYLYGLGNVIHMDELLTCEPRDSPLPVVTPLNSPMQATFFLSLDRRLDHKTWLKHDITSRQIPICDSTSWTTVKILSSSCLNFSWVLTLTFGPNSCMFAILRCSPLVYMAHKAVDVSQVCMVLKISADWS